MHTKIAIVGGALLLLVGLYALTHPKEANAPVPQSDSLESTTTIPQAGVENTDSLGAEESTEAPIPASQTATVVYDGDRFTPETVTIPVGGTVRFVNTGTVLMWVGADNHPTHTKYPVKSDGDCLGSSFDQCTATGNGSSWSYTFTEAGTWGYHNHRRAQDGGTVIVKAE